MKSDTFSTADIALAAFLVMSKRQLVTTERLHGGKYTFHFSDFPGRESELLSFFNRRTAVEPNAFLDHLKSLKSLTQQ